MTRYRCCKDLVGVIYAVGGQSKSGNSLSTVEVYDPIQGRWKDAEAMSMLRSRVGVAVMQNRLYATGGNLFKVGAKYLENEIVSKSNYDFRALFYDYGNEDLVNKLKSFLIYPLPRSLNLRKLYITRNLSLQGAPLWVTFKLPSGRRPRKLIKHGDG